MNFYVSVINETIEYIESSMNECLKLSEVSNHAGISDFHFSRMFSTVTGMTLKQYILGRKLTNAMEQLRTTHKSVIDIAFDLGFEYPEVFSRAFKKQFGMSPVNYRESCPHLEGIQRASVVERDIINCRGTLAIRGKSVFLDSFELNGINIESDTNSKDFKMNLKSKTEDFIVKSRNNYILRSERFYSIVSCSGNEDGKYKIFFGREKNIGLNNKQFDEFSIPSGWYAGFEYRGDMFDIREVFVDDLYRWIMVHEVEINHIGIGMLNIYDDSYPKNDAVQILVPIKKPV